MKALTINRMAAARLRANRKTYISLIVGIFLSVFLVTTLVLCIQGVILAQMEQTNKRLGYEDAILLDIPELSDGDLAELGYFDSIGHVYVSAGVKDTDIYLGHYDDTGSALLSRQLLEGRLPEQPGEIAMERSAMLAIREDEQWQLGDQVTLNLTPIDGVEEQRTYTLVEVLAEQSGQNTTDGAMAIMEDLLNRFPGEINAVLCHNDDTAIGAMQACEQAGVEGVKIIGFDGNVSAVELVLEGKLEGSVAQQPYMMGYTAVEAALQASRGEAVEPVIYVDAKLITIENGQEYLDSLG